MRDQARNVHQTNSFPAVYFERSLRRLTAKQQIACRNAIKVPVMLGMPASQSWSWLPARGVKVVPDTFLQQLRDLAPGKNLSVQSRSGHRFVETLRRVSSSLDSSIKVRVSERQRHGLPDLVTFTRIKMVEALSACKPHPLEDLDAMTGAGDFYNS